jgi:carboxypeptidase C (cathepsin A)
MLLLFRALARSLLPLLVALASVAPALSQDQAKPVTGTPADSVTHPRFRSVSGEAAYTVTAGTLPLANDKGERQASMFYVAYVRDGAPRDRRPVTFVFNGGPGASSALLHIGLMGPRIVEFGANGELPAPPGRLVDNPDNWLDLTDLVFIDPIGTSYSRTEANTLEANKRYWGVSEDLQSLATFIELYLTRNNRQLSPKYLAGESYGGFRAARLPEMLAKKHGIGLAGVFLLSPLLEFRLASSDNYDPLPDALRLPSYAAVAIERSTAPTQDQLSEVERFALGPYLTAQTGGIGNTANMQAFYAAVARHIGLPDSVVAQHGGRVPLEVFVKEMRRSDKLLISPYDGTTTAPDPYPAAGRSFDDPVLEGLRTVLSSTMADYLADKLGVRTELPYRVSDSEIARNWNWWSGLSGRGGFPGSGDELRQAMAGNRALKVMVAHGMTDLVTPYFATRYVLDHLPTAVTGNRVTFNLYSGGHMMYLRAASRTRVHADVAKFYQAPASR